MVTGPTEQLEISAKMLLPVEANPLAGFEPVMHRPLWHDTIELKIFSRPTTKTTHAELLEKRPAGTRMSNRTDHQAIIKR